MPTKTFFNLEQKKQDRIIQAAIDEFSQKNYDHANIATMIKNASIPRGSFYQYFEDKKDLYLYIIKILGESKVKYMSHIIENKDHMPFLKLIKDLYISGLKFAVDQPKLVKIMTYLIATKGDIYDEVMKDALDQSLALFTNLIEIDKSRGLIKESVDSKTFAKLMRDMTVNVTLSELNLKTNTFNEEIMIQKITQIIQIFETGVKKGDYHV